MEGDLLPRLMKECHKQAAVPAWFIFNAVFASGSWPTKWKTETAVIIPKNANPTDLSECRNISCTPFLSKVLEGVLLDDLRSELDIDPVQYGGIKQSSVDHLLVDMFDNILKPLDVGDPSLVVSIDFEKAFNRLDHNECLAQLRRLGASPASISLVKSFLTNRSMRVKIGNSLSDPRLLKGGSPQGSILGCLLYCVATQQLDLNLRARAGTTPASPGLASPLSTTNSSGEGMNIHDNMAGPLDAAPSPESTSSDDSFNTAPGTPLLSPLAVDELSTLRLALFKYIDDTTVVENVDKNSTVKHFTVSTTKEEVPAIAMSTLMAGVVQRALDIGMRINGKKTQAVCISPNNGCHSFSQLLVAGSIVKSADTMKLLGFMLGAAPGVHAQVKHIRDKFRRSFWSVIHLYRAGLRGKDLFSLYATFVRPVIETNCVVYHPMLTKIQSEQIERLQKLVTRLCFGFHVGYEEACRTNNIDKLKSRRKKAVEKFAAKSLKNRRFGPKWFVQRPEIDNNLRRRDKFVVPRANTDRYRNSPLLNLQRVANRLT